MEIFAGDLEPQDVMLNITAEITKLRLRHNRLVEFFRHLGIDRKKQRQTYIDKAVQHLEPVDLRDNSKSF